MMKTCDADNATLASRRWLCGMCVCVSVIRLAKTEAIILGCKLNKPKRDEQPLSYDNPNVNWNTLVRRFGCKWLLAAVEEMEVAFAQYRCLKKKSQTQLIVP